MLCAIEEMANKTADHVVRADYKGDNGHIPIKYVAGNFISRKGDLSSTQTCN